MTIDKAIERLEEEQRERSKVGDYYTDYEVTRLCLEALSRQQPRKMIKIGKSKTDIEIMHMCPTCKNIYNTYYKGKKYCMNCGQKLLWEDDEE